MDFFSISSNMVALSTYWWIGNEIVLSKWTMFFLIFIYMFEISSTIGLFCNLSNYFIQKQHSGEGSEQFSSTYGSRGFFSSPVWWKRVRWHHIKYLLFLLLCLIQNVLVERVLFMHFMFSHVVILNTSLCITSARKYSLVGNDYVLWTVLKGVTNTLLNVSGLQEIFDFLAERCLLDN